MSRCNNNSSSGITLKLNMGLADLAVTAPNCEKAVELVRECAKLVPNITLRFIRDFLKALKHVLKLRSSRFRIFKEGF